ncbi:MAG TPA: hypothetical protein VEC13_01275 [Candidatus Paceibacterota bacterium]|nr:hypothetical protein [Candidatus Paceibacterota bacterium]
MKKETKYIIGALIALVLIVVGISFLDKSSIGESDKYDSFAMCLSEKGAKFYGAFWCPHCQKQKAMFENSDKIPYVECSTPDTKGQLQVCTDKGVKSYPTWILADGSVLEGEIPLETLAQKTSCTLPQ